ncbi:possible transposase, N-terminal (plasmid) [Rhodococcus jostii RHA1]|uniref:Possible transposase, N-terminal n=1 Tax=Rhodococcus jostii (strain RHA1) TaxID=101510 RepID=Q0RV83_RHOJR|nr:possible transposase, N-terminal [Rhodococcus jostii RHA1]
MMFPLVRELAADGVAVAVTCRVLGFSRQAFYKWNTDPVSRRDWDDAHLINAALDIHAGDPEFGYRFIADELPTHGIVAGENRVHRLCSQQRIFSVVAKKRGLARRSGPPVHDDLVRRQFTAKQPDRLWLTDITEHWTDEGKLYLCAIKDCFSTEDRRLFDRRPDDRGPGVCGAAKCHCAPQPGRHRRTFRSRQPVPFRNLRRIAGPQWFTRINGEGGGMW